MSTPRTLGMFLAVGWLAIAFAPQAQAASVAELLEKINKLPTQERQRQLEEGAKKEGNLTVYSNQGIKTIRAYAKGFRKNIPPSKSTPPVSKEPEGWTEFSWNTAWVSLRPTSWESISTTSANCFALGS